ncbi:FAD-dependent pyridine nucleotide-disulfide oxidoreductase [Lepidopterella palustris CBS 459.81]|uniref:FAD-dependent pyridine nucleotide-disulfide oxidoreductase n=1 Tax=Lepidopterella palustris CBS 459.81 TaxID=1314670 RepID=A0A8E2E7J6_9PEZI|nr:FAD-dependent pyridine nucleotide-disulfide oxidoreductase [Lepidopterella palustris CBS 459.81]
MANKLPQKIVIVGGVAGGMSAATRARRLCETASITVLEKGPYVSYANCGIPYALGGVIDDDKSLLLNTPESFKSRFNIDVHVNSEVVAIDRIAKNVTVQKSDVREQVQHAYDKLILAQGAASFRLPIPGANLPCVFTLQTLDELKSIKEFIREHKSQRAVVIGGGFIGLEAAENLKHLGLEISIVEYAPHVLATIDAEMAEPIHAELRRQNVQLLLNAKVERIETTNYEGSVNVCTASGAKVPADIVLMAVGVRARSSLAGEAGLKLGKAGVSVNKYMQTSDPDIYAVGDMVETKHRIIGSPALLALAGPANRQGRLAADHIYGKKIAYRGNVGTSICKVFDMSIGSTGLSVEALRALGRSPEWVTVHTPNHASYYPGANPITLRVVFDPETGLLLGAQGLGKKHVDKRIDVLSTAIQAEMTICDLEHLELAYAPPYGSAKDPVNMAGFVGSNLLRGDVRIAHPEELYGMDQAKIEIVDVRSPSEFAAGHLVGAVNMPIDSLRESALALGKSKQVLVYCFVGYRGYLGYRILAQLGFDALNLDGGFKSVVEGGHTGLLASIK